MKSYQNLDMYVLICILVSTFRGPNYAGVARVVYTCLSGYTLSGTASVLCGINRQWGPTPQCISPNKEHTGLEEELSGCK